MRWAAALGNTISLSGSGPAEDAGHKERGQDRARLVMYLGGLMPCCMPALYSMLWHAAAQYCLYCSHQCAPRRSPSSPVPGHTTAVCPIDQVSAVAHSMYIDSPTTCPLLYVPTAILVLESWPGSGDALWSSAVQVACYSPNSTTPVACPGPSPRHGSGPSWSLPPPPGPGSGCAASCTCRANLPCARSLLLSQLNPSSLPDPQPDFRISLSASCLCPVPPTFCPVVHALAPRPLAFHQLAPARI